MDARNYINILRADADRRRDEAWQELHRRPDAEPLPAEVQRTWSERVRAWSWLSAAGRIAQRLSTGMRRGQRQAPAEPAPTVARRPRSTGTSLPTRR